MRRYAVFKVFLPPPFGLFPRQGVESVSYASPAEVVASVTSSWSEVNYRKARGGSPEKLNFVAWRRTELKRHGKRASRFSSALCLLPRLLCLLSAWDGQRGEGYRSTTRTRSRPVSGPEAHQGLLSLLPFGESSHLRTAAPLTYVRRVEEEMYLRALE